jgi:hypothetical protein
MELLPTLTGGLLVLVSWAVYSIAVIAVGLVPATLILHRTRGSRRCDFGVVIRHSLWWGLLLLIIWAYALNLWQPLGSAVSLTLTLLLVSVAGVSGVLLLRKFGISRNLGSWHLVPWQWKLGVGAVGLAVLYFALASLGPVTNYDSGLYHLGAIRYSNEYSVIPGLANLYFPFGYSNAQVPLAALLSNGPWGLNGFRLLSGLLIFLVGVELFLRTLAGSGTKKYGPGIYVLFVGLAVALIPLTALADFWVTSPTQDTAVFVLTVLTSAYLVDTVHSRKVWAKQSAILGALAITLVLFRPTAIFFAATVLIVVSLLALRRKGSRSGLALGTGIFIGVGLLALIVSTARDYFLSGWFQYPLSLISFPVAWKAADPTPYREATLGFHRDPEKMWESVSGFSWIAVWLTDRLALWETYMLLLLALIVVVLAVAAWRGVSVRVDKSFWRGLALCVLPSAVAIVAWFAVTPPSYRFAWGPLFTALTVPVGLLLWRAVFSRIAITIGAFAVIAVTVFSAGFRLDWTTIDQDSDWSLGVSIPYQIAPVAPVPVVDLALPSGLSVLVPVESDQCWDNYPLCTPAPPAGLRLRSNDQGDFGSGFLP